MYAQCVSATILKDFYSICSFFKIFTREGAFENVTLGIWALLLFKTVVLKFKTKYAHHISLLF